MIVEEKKKKARTASLYMYDGTPYGRVEAELDNWIGQVLRCDKEDVKWLLKHEKAQKPGIYLLEGKDRDLFEEEKAKKNIYIGEGGNISTRLYQHDKSIKKSFWETACLITSSKDGFLNKTICSYIEGSLIKQAKEINRANVENKQNPSMKVSDSDKTNAENFINELKLLLPVVNIDFLNPLRARDKFIKDFMFEIYHKSANVKAQANEIDGDFFVLKNSQAAVEKEREYNAYENLREELIKNGDLKMEEDGKTYIFTKDIFFPSVSSASSIVINGHSSGWREWKIRNTNYKKTYRDWRENPTKYNFAS